MTTLAQKPTSHVYHRRRHLKYGMILMIIGAIIILIPVVIDGINMLGKARADDQITHKLDYLNQRGYHEGLMLTSDNRIFMVFAQTNAQLNNLSNEISSGIDYRTTSDDIIAYRLTPHGLHNIQTVTNAMINSQMNSHKTLAWKSVLQTKLVQRNPWMNPKFKFLKIILLILGGGLFIWGIVLIIWY